MWRRPTALRSTTVDDGVLLLVQLGPGTVVVDFEPEVNPTTLSLHGWQAYMADVLARLNAAGVDLVLVTDPASLARAEKVVGNSLRMVPASSARGTVRQLEALGMEPFTAIWGACSIRTAALARRLDVPIVYLPSPAKTRRAQLGRFATHLFLVKEGHRPEL